MHIQRVTETDIISGDTNLVNFDSSSTNYMMMIQRPQEMKGKRE